MSSKPRDANEPRRATHPRNANDPRRATHPPSSSASRRVRDPREASASRQVREPRAPSDSREVSELREARVREMLLLLLAKSNRRSEFSSDVVAEAYREHRDLSVAERQAIRDRFYWLLGMRRRIEFALGAANTHPLAMVLAGEVLAGRKTPEDAQRELSVVAWQRVRDTDAALAAEPNPVRRLAIRHSLPDWIAHRLLQQLGDEADAFAAAQNTAPPMTVRSNLLRGTRDELATRLLGERIATEPGRHATTALQILTPCNLFKSPSFRDGWFEQQDEASQLVAEIVAPPPGGRVLDACAGSGGKTLALSALMESKGSIVAADIDREKLSELKRRGRRAGVTNVRPIRVPTSSWPDDVLEFARSADRILCDVPCSGLGVLRRNPDARWRLPETQLEVFGELQRMIALRAAQALQPGARLIYATCSVLREENELVIEHVLAQDAGLEPVRIAEILGNERALAFTDATGTYLKTYPHRHGMDGFFAAVLRRKR